MNNVWFLVEALKNTLDKGRGRRHDHRGRHRQAGAARHAGAPAGRGARRGVQMMTMHASRAWSSPRCTSSASEEDSPAPLQHRGRHHRGRAPPGPCRHHRAKRNLALTFAAKRKQYGEIIDCSPSRFLDEAAAGILVWEGQEDTPVEVKRRRAATTPWPACAPCSALTERTAIKQTASRLATALPSSRKGSAPCPASPVPGNKAEIGSSEDDCLPLMEWGLRAALLLHPLFAGRLRRHNCWQRPA